MPNYVTLGNWTDQGVRNSKETIDRAKAVEELAGKLGGRMTQVFWTIGPYDVVALSEFPDDETATAFALAVSSQGNVRTTSMRAFDADEMSRIFAKLP
jgi:uncharacterized protein with GYD domain